MTKMPAEMSTEMPAEMSTKMPTEMPTEMPAEMSSVIPAYTTPYIACRQSSCSVCHSEHQMSSTGHCCGMLNEHSIIGNECLY